ncbi:MAG: rRNA pseudouridine synthase [Candidatus Latescibacterota bacterium]|nr:MAG: rRNA pseudouridine synthase [Candidatus Latescibacterota bacterium]
MSLSPETSSGEGVRINRFLAAAGLGSRRKVEELVLSGRVTINGQPVRDLAARVDPERDRVRVGGRVVPPPRRVVYVLLHKPVDCLTTTHDPEGRRTIYEHLRGAPMPILPVGRLDRMTEGLLILTNDGPLAFRLAHPRYEVERVYRLWAAGEIDDRTVRRFRMGVRIEGRLVRPTEVRVVHRAEKRTVLEVVLHEGKNREIRRICRELQLRVDRLVRVQFGPLSIRGLGPGEWRFLSEKEADSLRRSVRLGVS